MPPARPATGLKQACAYKRQDHKDHGTDDIDPELRGNHVMRLAGTVGSGVAGLPLNQCGAENRGYQCSWQIHRGNE